MEKIKDEQLKELQELIGKINQGQIQIGQLETQKHTLLHQLSEIQQELQKFQETLEKEYGKVSINIQDGSYEAIKEDEPNKED
ncbi:MAG: hypothetical protein ABF265_06580 [Polaribacter sp.]|jgi:hypothetical protein